MLLAIWLSGLVEALSKLTWGRLKKLDARKDRRLVEAGETLIENRETYFLVLRFLILANLIVFAVLVDRALRAATWLEDSPWQLPVNMLIITVVFAVLSELIGRGLLASRPWPLLEWSMPAMRLCYAVLYPVAWPAARVQQRLTNFKGPEDDDERSTTADEIMSLVEQDAYEEAEDSRLEDSERRMIRGIFDLDETLVKEIMTPRVDVDGLAAGSTLDEAKELIVESGHSRIPVYRGTIDDIVGLIYAKDLLGSNTNGETPLEQLLHQPVFVPETKNIGELLEEFKATKNQIAVIIDEYGGTAGVVTIEDILEEIVGEIRDEYDLDEEDKLYQFSADGLLVTQARLAIDEVNELLDLDISEDEDYDTIGGYVTSRLGRIPKTQERVVVDELEVQVLAADERKLERLTIRKLEPVDESEANGK